MKTNLTLFVARLGCAVMLGVRTSITLAAATEDSTRAAAEDFDAKQKEKDFGLGGSLPWAAASAALPWANVLPSLPGLRKVDLENELAPAASRAEDPDKPL